MKALNEMIKLQNAGKLNVLTVGKAKELRGKKIQILNTPTRITQKNS